MKIFFDVDTQNDFMNRNGALYVPGAEEIKPNLKHLTEFGVKAGIPFLGSVDKHFGTEEYKHRESELKRWGGPFPDHCMAGTEGQSKIWQSYVAGEGSGNQYWVRRAYLTNPLRGQKTILDAESGEFLPIEVTPENLSDTIKKYLAYGRRDFYERWEGVDVLTAPGIFFEKQQYDASTNPMFKPVLKSLGVTEAVVCGVATDYCVKGAALALRKLGIEVYLVTDAIAAVTEEGGKSALEEMLAAGVKPVTTAEVLEGKLTGGEK